MSSALCEKAMERIADEQNPLNKKADAPRAHAGGMPEFVPTCRYVLPFFQKLAPCLVGIEACASCHHWSLELQALCYTMHLMPPAYVKPYVKRQKNDAAPHLLSVNPGAQSLG